MPFIGRIQLYVSLGLASLLAVAMSGSVVSDSDCIARSIFSCAFGAVFTFVISLVIFFVPLYLLLIIYNFLDKKSTEIAEKEKAKHEVKAEPERVFIAPPASPAPVPTPSPVAATPAPTPSPVASTTKVKSTDEFRQMLKDYLAD